MRLPFGKKLPVWASHLKISDFKYFQSEVEDEIHKQGYQGAYDWDEGIFSVADREMVIGFHNLVHFWAREKSREEIADFLQTVLSMAKDSEVSWEEAKNILHIKIGTCMGIKSDVPGMIESPAGPWPERIVLDFERHNRNPSSEEIKQWNQSREVLRETALQNVWREPVDVNRIEIGGHVCTLIESHHFYGASHALLLDRYLDESASLGAVVAIPYDHLFVFASINQQTSTQFLEHVAGLARHLCTNNPNPISDQIFWYLAGKFVDLPYQIVGGAPKLDESEAHKALKLCIKTGMVPK